MRLLGLVSILCLGACSTATPMTSIPLPDWTRLPPNISKAQQPYPGDYAQLVTRRLLVRGETAEISAPVPYKPWSINDPLSWSLCLRRADTSVTVVILAAGKVSGTIVPAPTGFCEAAAYTPIQRDALPA